MRRRTFLEGTIGMLTLAGLARVAAAEPLPTGDPGERRGDMLYRPLGSTGVTVSAIGLGGFHIGVQKDEQESIRIIRSAVDRGITFLDNCWDYNGGASEERMGKALRDGYRDKIFLMTKVDGRTRDGAAKQIDESLRRLDTDHLDLVQVHETIRLEDPDRVFADGGAIEAFVAARKAGKTRFIGFTGHKDPSVHNRMLDTASAHGFRFDTVQMPLNPMDAHFRSFGHEVLPRLVRDKIGVLGMKSMGGKVLLDSKTVTPIECLHYALNLPTSTVITGIDSMPVLDQAFEAARTFRPMGQDEVQALLAKTAIAAATGRYELFKTSNVFDGTARHPEWLA
jgi:predicted aldo/keto reductase-like oxidoreductase